MNVENMVRTIINLIYIQFTLQLLISEYIFLVKKEKRFASWIPYVLSFPVLFFLDGSGRQRQPDI